MAESGSIFSDSGIKFFKLTILLIGYKRKNNVYHTVVGRFDCLLDKILIF